MHWKHGGYKCFSDDSAYSQQWTELLRGWLCLQYLHFPTYAKGACTESQECVLFFRFSTWATILWAEQTFPKENK